MTKRRIVEDLYPLSPLQKGMLFHALHSPDSGLGITQSVYELRGSLQPAALRRAAQEVLDRHSALRTAFNWKSREEPFQVVYTAVRLPWVEEDWRETSASDREALMEEMLAADLRRQFELSRPPLLRVALIRFEETVYRLVWTSHHLVLDGWSQPLLFQELVSLYRAFCAGDDLRLPQARPFADYIAWINRQSLSEAEDFWRTMFSGYAASARPLCGDCTRHAPIRDGASSMRRISMGAAATEALRAFALRHQLTLNTVVLGAWCLLLSRLSGEEDVVCGTTVSGRPPELPGVESMVGMFINTLPVRVMTSLHEPSVPWLQRLQDLLVGMRRFEHTPLVDVHGWSGVARNQPLFESLLSFQNFAVRPAERQERGGAVGDFQAIALRSVDRATQPLVLVAEPGRELVGRMLYQEGRFTASSVSRLLEQLRTLLQGMADFPGARIGDLPLISRAERQQMVIEWNATASGYPTLTIHDLFERQARRTPDAVALVCASGELTYAELDRRANRLANCLRAFGVGPEILVGVCMERSAEVILALLAILKAGGAYVPLDPTYPLERLAFMLADLFMPVLLTEERLVERLPTSGMTQILRVDSDREWIALQADTSPQAGAMPDNLAYAMYTSGSMGRPKGVGVLHRGVVRLVRESNYARFGPAEVFLQFAPIAFDASTFEIWGALLNGGCLALPDPGMVSLAEVGQLVKRYGVTTVWLTAGLFHEMVESHLEGLLPLRQILAGGDVLSPADVTRVLETATECRLFNGYGPTEGTTFTCCHEMTRTPEADSPVPIGRPIANTEIFLLDGGMRPVAVGVPGELLIGGDGLARGYLNRPELTAERWIPDAVTGRRGERLYRTGDLTAFQPDGRVEFLGRIDRQVKVRGFRIEPGEIETTLSRHPAVRENAVTVNERSGERRLVAYVVEREPGQDTTALFGDLRAFLGEQLPDHMVPQLFVPLPALPLTPTGKVDRRALPAPDGKVTASAAYVAPSDRLEEELAAIWSEVLGRRRVGVRDNFFELGGHSLLALRVISQVRYRYGIEPPLHLLFEEPTIASLAAWLKSDEGALATSGQLAIRRAPRVPGPAGELVFPLSFAQQRLWFLSRLAPRSVAYNVPLSVRLAGRLDVAILARSLEEMVRRHEVLHTIFGVDASGEPIQVLSPLGDFYLPYVDLRALGAGTQEELRRLVAEEAQRPFDLERGPLFRPRLLCLSAEDNVVLATLHHIVSDGWSLAVIVRELVAFYAGLSAGLTAPLPELPLQYADYAVWQREWLSGEVLEAELAWWKERLEDLPMLLELPTDRPRPAAQTFRGAWRSRQLGGGLASSLSSLAKQEGATLFMVLLAVFEALLARYTGQERFVVGTPVAGRDRAEIEGLIGFFVNALALPAEVSGERLFRDLLAQVREIALEAFAHQALPFERLLQELRLERNLAYPPLIQVVLVLQNTPQEPLQLPGLQVLPMEGGDTRAAQFDLTLTLTELRNGLSCMVEYNTDLFDRATGDRFLGHYETLLEEVLAEPGRQLSTLSLLGGAERHQVILEWNPPRELAFRRRLVDEIFAAQARRSPDAVAAAFDRWQVTYEELNRRANRLAHRLRNLGVGPEVRVGVCMERSLEVVATLLGILKAGGAYLPLDPTFPRERLAFMIEDGRAAVLVTQSRLRDVLPVTGTPVLCIDRSGEDLASGEATDPRSDAVPENLAYVMYTSGSTGRPKGVSIPHSAISWFVSTLAYVDPRPADRFAQGSTHTFDAATFELWGALTHGARLTGIPKEVMISPRDLAARLDQEEVSVLYLTAALFMQTVSQEPGAFRSLRRLLVGGEVVDAAFFRRALASGAPERLLYLYGPTETTVFSTWQVVDELPDRPGQVSIGRPIADAPHYLLGPDLRPVPIGVYGEVYVGGGGLARDYLNRPDLTAERFVPNPFCALLGEPGGRLYRTGDLVRHLPDGRMEFRSRVDTQVKIRGFRIEPREIEAQLVRHPAVREALVIAREDAPGDKRLVAYVVPREGRVPGAAELRDMLKEELPDYMVPSAFVPLAALPLSAHGKVNRRELPAPQAVLLDSEEPENGPRTPTEEIVEGLFAEVLQVDRVGSRGDFFILGGHSLLAAQLVSRLRNTFQLDLPLRTLFDEPTVSGLAGAIDELGRKDRGRLLPPLTRVDRSGDLPLSFGQQRLWFIHQMEPESPAYNMPAAVRVSGALDVAVLAASLGEVVRRHEVLRTRYMAVLGKPVQVIEPPAPLALPVVDLGRVPSALQEKEVLRLDVEESLRPFDLTRAPMLRALAVRLHVEEWVILFVMHHIASDGWSMGVLTREISALYGSFTRRREPSLPELPLQYADFARWQRDRLSEEALADDLAYWRESLAGAPSELALPLDRTRPPEARFRGAMRPARVPPALVEGLKSLCRRRGVTLFMATLAAFQALLARYSGQSDVSLGTPVAGRVHLATEDLIGLFLNTLVLRVKLDAEAGFADLLGRVRESALGAYAHQDLPFERLVEELQPERSLGRSPFFQVMFTLQNARPASLALPGMRLRPLEATDVAVQFDWSLELVEQPSGLGGSLHYRTDLFDAVTVDRALGHFAILLEAALADPQRSLAELPLLAEAERQLLTEWGGAVAPLAESVVHERFAEQAGRIPEAVAVAGGARILTFGELDRRSNRLARHLQALGVGPEVRVAVFVERSVEMMIGLLGVLKAGGTYLPLDPSYPQERLELLRRDGRAAVLLTQRSLAGRLAAGEATVVCLDADGPAVARRSARRAEPVALPENAAYTIYTSGSTGEPKGAVISHRALLTYALSLIEELGLQQGDRMLQFASLSFDVAVEEIFPTLLAGATVVLRDALDLASGDGLGRAVQQEEVTLVELPTAFWHEWVYGLEQSRQRPPRCLRLLLVGGEPALPERLAAWQGFGVPLVHVFGLTEVTVTSTLYPVTAGEGRQGLTPLPIGRPFGGNLLRVLDSRLWRLPVGVVGELYLGGACLARCYLDRPELTAERFVPDPFAAEPGARMYRTGDLARYRGDGNLEFLGRIDHQVKVRGFRIEPGEIEATLTRHPSVREAVVMAREDGDAGKRLVAYVVAAQGRPLELWPSHGEYPIYDELLYHAMTRDEERNRRYREAIRQAVRGKVVVDIGTGAEALLSRFCVEAGAARVYAIEALEESCRRARSRIDSLGLGGRIVLVEGSSTEVELPEPVDVCVSEIIGTIGGSEGAAALLSDARRFLKPGGTLIPSRCLTRIAAVRLPEDLVEDPGFTPVGAHYARQILESVGRSIDLRLCIKNFPPSHLVSDVGVFERLEFENGLQPSSSQELCLGVLEDTRVDGFLLWIELTPGQTDTLDSLRHDCSWLPLYLPVFDGGVEVAAGDVIAATALSRLSDDGVHPDYELSGVLYRPGREDVEFHYVSPHHQPASRPSTLHRKLLGGDSIRVHTNGARGVAGPDLRAYLAELLPGHMVPTDFVFLDALPLTLNGKVDRRALPAPEVRQPGSSEMYVAPRTPAQEVMAAIWSDVLELERVGIHDNFFALGGHSLLATRVTARLESAFGVKVPLRDLFEAPTVAGLSLRVEQAMRTEEAGPPSPPVVPVPRDRDLPLSFAQQRLWFLDQLQPGSSAYNVPLSLRLRGALDLTALERALSAVVRRHEILRTVFKAEEGTPFQLIAPPVERFLPLIDLGGLPAEVRDTEGRRLVREEALRPFDLSHGPVFRASLARLGEPDDHLLLAGMHHIAGDGWSMAILIGDVVELYGAFASGRPSRLPDLPVQYADYAVWQRAWLQGEVLAGQLAYWRQRLAGAQPLLELPTDRPRPALSTGRGRGWSFQLEEALTSRLRTLAHRQGATFFMILVAGLQELLARYSGQREVSVGTSVAGRVREELERLVGFFLNTLVLRTDLRGDPDFQELIGRVRETSLGAYAHQDLPFEKVVEEFEPERDVSRSPLFQVMVVLQNIPEETVEVRNLEVRPVESPDTTAKFDLTFSFTESGKALSGGVEYRADLFDGATITRLVGHLERLLEEAVESPETRLSDLPLLNRAEYHQIVWERNDTRRAAALEICLQALFESQVEISPESVALVCGELELSYRDLDRRADRLAYRLRQGGVGPEVLVGLCVERSPEMVIGVLAILKAGGAYLPLDPSYPSERLAWLVENSRIGALLIRQGLEERLPAGRSPVFYLNIEANRGAGEAAPRRGASPENLAYMIYTSGSTGSPKGVMISHRGAVNYLTWAIGAYGVDADSVVPLHSPIGFDLTVTSLFAPLLSGGRLVLMPEERGIEALGNSLQTSGFGLVKVTPAHLSILEQALSDRDLSGCSGTLVVGGEALFGEAVSWWGQRAPRVRLVNEYGPTETVVGCCVYEVTGAWPARGPVPIGRPIANTRIYLLDPGLHPVVPGVTGGLYVSGDGVARGYHRQPGLTAESFVPNPCAVEPGERLYRTGDLARLLPSGDLEFLGRDDHQVKIRGFRIEPGEIEAVLVSHPQVREAAVLAREDVPGDRRLVAYLVPCSPVEIPLADELTSALKRQLPEYMIPAVFVVLEKMPLTPNGKLDRRALPEPVRCRTEEARVIPRDWLELQLIQIWEDLLGVQPVRIGDDFFSLGGHSLLGVRLMSRIESLLGVRLPLTLLFQAPTIEKLASVLRERRFAAGASSLVLIRRRSGGPAFFCVHPAHGNILCYLELARRLKGQRPFYGFQVRRIEGEPRPTTRVEDLAGDYLQELRAVQPAGPYLLGGWSMGGVVAFEMARQLEAQGERIALLALIDAHAPSHRQARAPIEDAALLLAFARDLELDLAGLDLGALGLQLQGLVPDQRLGRIFEAARDARVLLPDVNLDRLRGLFEVFRSNVLAMFAYSPKPFGGRVTLFRATRQEAAASRSLGWGRWARGGVDVIEVPGDHHSIVRVPDVDALAAQLESQTELQLSLLRSEN